MTETKNTQVSGETPAPAAERPSSAAAAAGTQSAGRRRRWRAQIARWALPLVLLAVVVGLWEAAVTVGGVHQYLLPGPGTVLSRMVMGWDDFLGPAVPTIIAIVVGFAAAVVIAVLIAVAMVYSSIVRRALYPLLIVAQVVPKVALAPLFIIWFGFGESPKILMVTLICFFPIVIDSVVGLSAARPESLMLVRSMGASRWQAFWKIRWPWALPNIFAGIKVGITLAIVGAVVAEFVGANQGLGVVLVTARGNLDSVTVFAAIGWLTIIGLVLFALVTVAERFAVHGARSRRQFEASGTL